MTVNLDAWVEKIRSGDTRALARGLSEIEDRGPHAEALLRALFPFSGRAWRIGVTGPPGAGKSTLVNCLAGLLRKQNRTVAVIAVDPTSPYTGGSILGDRVRMLSHHADPGVFVRSMATRGALGGLAPATGDVITAVESSGRDIVIIETVGVGQADIDVVKLASPVALVLTPGMGDDVQTLKAGVIEIAHVFVINKADQPGADRTQSQLEAMLSLLPEEQKKPPIVRTVATHDQGTDELLATLEAVPPDRQRIVEGWKQRLLGMVQQRLVERLLAKTLDDGRLAAAARDIAQGKLNPYEFVDQVMERTVFEE